MGFNMNKTISKEDINVFNFELKNAVHWTRPLQPKHKTTYYKFKNSSEPIKFVEGYIFRGTTGIIALKEDLFFETFKNAFQRLFEAGITNHIIIKTSDKEEQKTLEYYKSKLSEDFKVYNEKKELVPLSLSQLGAAFIIWLTAVLIVILVFFLEFLHFKCSQAWEKFLFNRETELIMKNERRLKAQFMKVGQVQQK